MVKNKISLLLIPCLAIFLFFLTQIDRWCFKAGHSFCLHYIEGPPTPDPRWEVEAPFPHSVLDQPFTYLGKGAQSFVFESADHQWVIKFYKFPAHLRRFDWLKHPFGDAFSPKNQIANRHNDDRFRLSFHSYLLAFRALQEETGVVYIHLNPTPHLQKTLEVYDRAGRRYLIPLRRLGYVVQRKGEPFLPLLRSVIAQGKTEQAQQMIDGLIQLIASRCRKGITDLDNMAHNNYGWREGKAMHLDIGRFVQSEEVKIPYFCQQEVRRITQPLQDLLEKESPDLLEYYSQVLRSLNNA